MTNNIDTQTYSYHNNIYHSMSFITYYPCTSTRRLCSSPPLPERESLKASPKVDLLMYKDKKEGFLKFKLNFKSLPLKEMNFSSHDPKSRLYGQWMGPKSRLWEYPLSLT